MKKTAPLLIVFAAILWSLDGVLRRELRTLPVATLVMLEHCVGFILLLPFLPRSIKKLQKVNKKEWLILFLVSIFGGVLGTIFYTAALAKVNFISYTVVVLLQQTQPIFAVVLAYFLLKEKITKQYFVLASIGLFSAYFLSFPTYIPSIIGNSQELIAASFALAAAVCWGSATVLGKLILKKVDFLTTTTVRFAIVIPVAYIIGYMFDSYLPISEIFSTVTARQWYYIWGISCTAGVVSICIYYKGLEHTPAQVSTILELVYPVSAAYIGYQFLNESLTTTQEIAGVVLFLVIFKLASDQMNKKKRTQELDNKENTNT